ncbi:MAG: hypothetical protein PVH28_05585 [Desulfobacterales bacterium]|jgi:hypothetical protein
MEYWKNGILGIKAGDVLILIADQCHQDKNGAHSTERNIPTFHYSGKPWYSIPAKPMISKLTVRTKFSIIL